MNAHTLRSPCPHDLARVEVLHEARLVDRHQRAEAHRDGRELPEVRGISHGCGYEERPPPPTSWRKRRSSSSVRRPSRKARVEARGRVPLEVDEVAEVLVGAAPPEVVEADLVERLGGLVARDVAAELGRLGVRLEDDRDRVPAHERRREPLELGVAGQLGLVLDGDRVDVRRRDAGADRHVEVLRVVDRAIEEVRHSLAPVGVDDGVDGVEPLLGLDGIGVGRDVDAHAPSVSAAVSRRYRRGVAAVLVRRAPPRAALATRPRGLTRRPRRCRGGRRGLASRSCAERR